MRRCARGDEEVEIVRRGFAQARVPGLRWLVEHVDGLSGTVEARRVEPPPGTLPELADGLLLTDDHPSPARPRRTCERRAAGPGGHDVRADMTQRLELPVGLRGDEPAQTSPGDVLEVHALDRLFRAESSTSSRLGSNTSGFFELA